MAQKADGFTRRAENIGGCAKVSHTVKIFAIPPAWSNRSLCRIATLIIHDPATFMKPDRRVINWLKGFISSFKLFSAKMVCKLQRKQFQF